MKILSFIRVMLKNTMPLVPFTGYTKDVEYYSSSPVMIYEKAYEALLVRMLATSTLKKSLRLFKMKSRALEKSVIPSSSTL